MKQNKQVITIGLLVLAAVMLTITITASYYKRHPVAAAPGSNTNASLIAAQVKNVDLPVPIGSSNVGLVFIHYFFSGSIKEINKVATGTQITLDSDNKSIPDIILTDAIPIAKVTVPPPATPVPAKPLTVSQLKPGQNVDVSMEFDPVLKHWVVLAVYLPSNKNP